MCTCRRGWSHAGQRSCLSSEGRWGGACQGGQGKTSGRALSRALPLDAATLCHSPPHCITERMREDIIAGRDGEGMLKREDMCI